MPQNGDSIEVKNARRIDVPDILSLKHFAADYPQAKRYLPHCGDDRLNIDGVLCIPAEQFLLALKPDSFPE